jgi:pSer/pThr/pTyr-binding forkhead associated (FHA) protein
VIEHHNGHEKRISMVGEGQKRNWHLVKAQVRIEVDGKLAGTFPLNKPVLAIGRFPGSEIQIESPRVSRFHALIRWRSDAWIIEDAESLNGLVFEGQRISQMGLVHGDRIHLDPRIILHYEE